MKKLTAFLGTLLFATGCAGDGTDAQTDRQDAPATRNTVHQSVDDVPGQRPSDLDRKRLLDGAPSAAPSETQRKNAASQEAFARCGAPVDAEVDFVVAGAATRVLDMNKSKYVLIVADESDVAIKVTSDVEKLCIVTVSNGNKIDVSVEGVAVKQLVFASTVGKDQVSIHGDGSYACPSAPAKEIQCLGK